MRYLLMLLLTLPAPAKPWKTSSRAKLELRSMQDGFQLTVTNTQRRPLALLPPSRGWCHGWKVVVKDQTGAEFGMIEPPGPAFLAEPSRFSQLAAGQKITVKYRFADFLRVNRQTDQTEYLKQPARVEVGYTLQPDRELSEALSMARAAPTQGEPQVSPAWAILFQQADFLTPSQASLTVHSK